MQEYQTLAVGGTHGKTTTSSLLVAVLQAAQLDPTFAVGGVSAGSNGRLGKGCLFVAEADESDGSFLRYRPKGAIITNVEPEHLDYYKTEEALHRAFGTFLEQIEEERWLFLCGDDPVLRTLSPERGSTYGFGPENMFRILHYRQEGWFSYFDLMAEGVLYRNIKLALIGQHNALNAAAVFGLTLRLGIDVGAIYSAFAQFGGVKRRCEHRGTAGGVLLIDDYGHHPTEINYTLQAVKQAAVGRRVVVVLQPHRYSRLAHLWDAFSRSFIEADLLYVTDVYSAFEAPLSGIDGARLVDSIRDLTSTPCSYVPRKEICQELRRELRSHDILLTFGAGDITTIHAELLRSLQPPKWQVGLIFGGRSCEHEVSLRSARCVASALDRTLYDIHFFGIDKEGGWLVGKEAEKQLFTQTALSSFHAQNLLDSSVTQAMERCDLFFPVLHGSYGEDGTIQGFFEMMGKPYVGPNYRSAAICMNKVLTKQLVATKNISTPKDIHFGCIEWRSRRSSLLQEASMLSLPLYVKPVNRGSSVGITKVDSYHELGSAIDEAFRFDTQVMVEEGVVECRELEFAVIGNTQGSLVCVPQPGEKLGDGAFITYEKKYGAEAVATTVHVDLPPDLLEKGQRLARLAYEAVGSSGMTRVDFLLDRKGEFWFFEMNAIPGLQALSLFPKIWQREGVSAQQLYDKLIIFALEEHRLHNRYFSCAVL
jgi:UDP-N-acetylmuramate--alanine ligase